MVELTEYIRRPDLSQHHRVARAMARITEVSKARIESEYIDGMVNKIQDMILSAAQQGMNFITIEPEAPTRIEIGDIFTTRSAVKYGTTDRIKIDSKIPKLDNDYDLGYRFRGYEVNERLVRIDPDQVNTYRADGGYSSTDGKETSLDLVNTVNMTDGLRDMLEVLGYTVEQNRNTTKVKW